MSRTHVGIAFVALDLLGERLARARDTDGSTGLPDEVRSGRFFTAPQRVEPARRDDGRWCRVRGPAAGQIFGDVDPTGER